MLSKLTEFIEQVSGGVQIEIKVHDVLFYNILLKKQNDSKGCAYVPLADKITRAAAFCCHGVGLSLSLSLSCYIFYII